MPAIPTPVLGAKPHDWFKGGHNYREIVIDEGIRELGRSEADQGFLQPVGAVDRGDHGETLYGFRRLTAYGWALSEKLPVPETIPVLLYPPSLTDTQRCVVTATENIQREDLTDPQKFRLCKKLLELNPRWTRKDLAAHLNKHPSTITQWLSPDDLIPDGLQAFLEGRFGYSLAYKIAGSPDQANALAKVLNGSSRARLEDDNRNHRNGHGAQPTRLVRYRIPVATDAAKGEVALSIPENSDLAAVETALKDAEKAVRLPRVKITPPGDETAGMVAVSRESPDPNAEALLQAALKIVQDARSNRKITLKTAQVEWQQLIKAARDAKMAQAAQPTIDEPEA
jgi:ParB/RepB/Spo0J family partition protein